MGQCETEEKYKALLEEQQKTAGDKKAAPKKGEPQPTDYSNYKELPEYAEELVQEFI